MVIVFYLATEVWNPPDALLTEKLPLIFARSRPFLIHAADFAEYGELHDRIHGSVNHFVFSLGSILLEQILQTLAQTRGSRALHLTTGRHHPGDKLSVGKGIW